MSVKKFRSRGYSPDPNRKIISVNERQGFGNLSDQQGTTRIIYDSILFATSANNTMVRLFEGSNTRQFPLTNLTENKLQVKESIVMERMSLYVTQCTTGTTNALAVVPLGYYTGLARTYAGQMNFTIGQNQVIKKMPVSSMFAPLNKSSRFFGYYQIQPLAADPVTSFQYPHDVYEFENDIVIPPMTEFYMDIQLPPIAAPAGYDFYLTARIEGLGSLYAPKSTF